MYRYVAPEGHYVPGVPARDLTDEEYAAVDPSALALAEQLGFFEHVKDEPKPKAERPKPEAAKAEAAKESE